MKARKIMIKHIFMIEGSVTVAEAVKKMGDDKVSSLIVNRADVDDAYGILTRRDVVNKVIATGKDPHKIKVSEVMSKPLVMTTPNLDIRYVAGLMQETGV
ncbi:MAG: CBS domain-containing protein, partial [Thermodesulfobacteriota bacterium]